MESFVEGFGGGRKEFTYLSKDREREKLDASVVMNEQGLKVVAIDRSSFKTEPLIFYFLTERELAL